MLAKFKTAAVLLVIGALSGLIIYLINDMTEETIAQNKIDREIAYYKELFDLDETTIIDYDDPIILGDGLDEELILYDVDDEVIGYIYKSTVKNNYGEVTVLVGITPEGVISNAVISSTSNTPTFVQTIKKNYIGNFSGQDTSDIEIDSRTGATYTYTAVVEVVENASAYYLESRGE